MSTRERFVQQVEHYERALARLLEVLEMSESAVVRDSIIKRFEFTFEMAWKAMYRWLRAKDVEIVEEPFEVIPRAFNAGLIDDDAGWTEVRKARNKTSHTYDEKKAIEVSALVRTMAVPLFRKLAERLRKEATGE